MKRFVAGICLLVLFVGSSELYAQDPCPDRLPPDTACYSGVDDNGAYYLIAVPTNNYNNRLVLWNHGYDLAPPRPLTHAEDLGYSALLLSQGYAVAASSYRPDPIGLGGWAVADGAEDTENLRRRFIEMFGFPELTFVVGASEGGIVTATMIELFGTDKRGNLNYNGAMPMCGPLAGGRRNWYGGLDLRVVYQYYCRNLPRPDETQYPLYLGLDPDNTITPIELALRVNDCTGILLPPDLRTPKQRENLSNILNVTKIPEGFLLTDMSFATFALQELVQVRTDGRSPVTNLEVAYSGSTDDDALNAGVFRSGSSRKARRWLSAAYDPTGDVFMSTLTMHTIGDGLVIVENENAYRETLEAAGNLNNLFQTYTNAGGHCEFSFSEFMASFRGLVSWVETSTPPTQDQIADLCEQFRPVFGDTCKFNTTFQPDTFESRVPAREP